MNPDQGAPMNDGGGMWRRGWITGLALAGLAFGATGAWAAAGQSLNLAVVTAPVVYRAWTEWR